MSRHRAPHIVFTNGRSGSNFIVDGLNQHPNLCNYGEVLGPYMPSMKLHQRIGYGGRTVVDYLDHVLTSRRHFRIAQAYSAVSRLSRGQRVRRKQWPALASIGVKDFAIRFAERDVTGYLAARPEIKVISLHRENTFRRVISLLSMEQTGVVSVDATAGRSGQQPISGPGERQFEVDVAELMYQMKILEREKEDQLAVVDGLDSGRCFRLTYEELFSSAEASQDLLAEVYRFLGVEPRTVETNHRRILPVDARDMIVNYRDVEQALTRAGLDRYLD